MRRRIISGFIVFSLVVPTVTVPAEERLQQDIKNPVVNKAESYFKIVSLYQKILGGLPGSRNFHVFEMKQYMDKLPGKDFTTDYDFKVVADSNRLELQAAFPERRWMHIHCDRLVDALSELKKKHDMPGIQTWWRRGFFFAVTGNMRYYIIKSESSVEVHIYLRDVKLLLSDK